MIVITGRVEQGKINVGDAVSNIGLGPDSGTACTGVEMLKVSLESLERGNEVNCSRLGLSQLDAWYNLRLDISSTNRRHYIPLPRITLHKQTYY